MNKLEACAKIKELLDSAQYAYDWGGSEDSDGCLSKGYVDFDKLSSDIAQIVNNISNGTTMDGL